MNKSKNKRPNKSRINKTPVDLWTASLVSSKISKKEAFLPRGQPAQLIIDSSETIFTPIKDVSLHVSTTARANVKILVEEFFRRINDKEQDNPRSI
jgi:hypothetical protein